MSHDDIDRGIVSKLNEDGRMSSKDIAAALNVSEGTVRNRVARMVESGSLRVAGLISPDASPGKQLILLGVNLSCSQELVGKAEEISKLDAVLSVYITAGAVRSDSGGVAGHEKRVDRIPWRPFGEGQGGRLDRELPCDEKPGQVGAAPRPLSFSGVFAGTRKNAGKTILKSVLLSPCRAAHFHLEHFRVLRLQPELGGSLPVEGEYPLVEAVSARVQISLMLRLVQPKKSRLP